MRSLTNKVNIMLAMIAAMLLAVFMLADTAWGLTYKDGDVWIGTDGEEMTAEEASQWGYDVNYGTYRIYSYTGTFIDGKINGCVPEYINGNPVEELGDTFRDCTELVTAPELPDTVTELSNTFSGCSNLINAPDLPQKLITMNNTFMRCTSLVTPPLIPKSVTDMSGAFCDCTSLEYCPQIPYGVTNISGTFSSCKKIETFPILPNSITKADSTFAVCTKIGGEIVIPDNLQANYRTMFQNIHNDKEIIVKYTPECNLIQYNQFNQLYYDVGSIKFVKIEERPPETLKPIEPEIPSNPGETEGNLTIWGTVNPINMIDVTVPLTIEFIIESDRTFTGPDDITITSNCPSPLDVILYGVNKSEEAPALCTSISFLWSGCGKRYGGRRGAAPGGAAPHLGTACPKAGQTKNACAEKYHASA